ncbi:hypothetical protein HGM15179_015242 [Zosterops borbonicus]|uniref:Uncharacterized protein n=1 Tax=Zosterops borbonicus TaxID=364589 RepID=A0A8K1G4T5_9PASS|nr:hypothetical protein HGM15179_015242 [Zosterops borbonicus]
MGIFSPENNIFGCIQSTEGSRVRKGILTHGSIGIPPAVLPPALESPTQERQGAVGASPEEASKMIKGMDHIFLEKRLREVRMFSLEKKRFMDDLIVAFQYLKGAYERNEAKLQEWQYKGEWVQTEREWV